MSSRLAHVVVLTSCFGLAGCGGRANPASTVTVTVEASPSDTASSTEDADTTAYKIGQTSNGKAGSVKVSDYRFRMPHPDWVAGGTDHGMAWAGFHVAACMNASAANPIKVGAEDCTAAPLAVAWMRAPPTRTRLPDD